MSMPPWDNEIEMFDEPFWTWENVLTLLWRSIVIVTACATIGVVLGYAVGRA